MKKWCSFALRGWIECAACGISILQKPGDGSNKAIVYLVRFVSRGKGFTLMRRKCTIKDLNKATAPSYGKLFMVNLSKISEKCEMEQGKKFNKKFLKR
jgi:hypothetical protein